MSAQARNALAVANMVKARRRELVGALAGGMAFADLDLTDPALARMRCLELVALCPWKVGGTKRAYRERASRSAVRVLGAAGVPLTREVGALTERQRVSLRAAMVELCPSQRGAR